jgi:hypothetical protein
MEGRAPFAWHESVTADRVESGRFLSEPFGCPGGSILVSPHDAPAVGRVSTGEVVHLVRPHRANHRVTAERVP